MYRMYDEFILSVATEQENPIKYRSVVMESVKNSATVRARLVDVLYQDIVKRKNYNFDVIPSTMGNVTKMPSYATFLEALEALKQLTAGEKKGQVHDTVQLVVDLHNKIVIRRADFEYGYKMHIDIIQLAYCTSVSALYQLMNVCIYAVSSTVTDGVTMAQAFNKACAKNDYLLQSAMGMSRALDDKNWKEFMTPLKKNTKNFLGTNPESVVREAFEVEDEFEVAEESVAGVVGAIGAGLGIAAKVGGVIIGGIMAGYVIGNGILAVMSAISEAMYGLYVAKGRVAEWISFQKALIDHAMGEDDKLANDKMMKGASKVLGFIQGRLDRELSTVNKTAKDEKQNASRRQTFSNENLKKTPTLPIVKQEPAKNGPKTDDSDVMIF